MGKSILSPSRCKFQASLAVPEAVIIGAHSMLCTKYTSSCSSADGSLGSYHNAEKAPNNLIDFCRITLRILHEEDTGEQKIVR